jgi:hypothetical protein
MGLRIATTLLCLLAVTTTLEAKPRREPKPRAVAVHHNGHRHMVKCRGCAVLAGSNVSSRQLRAIRRAGR